ncbi:YkgJ family cysteine cluster protein [Desulfatibacillum aliphaticivorans]|uniref:YkgJ family cysteine cluster protein n=1 Tax=Desulfatibacillum aliphaticivorans TaxID=218208 RepID=UPI000686CFBD|nr:YkgJ family cysteine cluster protein [Desulfatibacillum aliphaticivorans]
MAEIKTGRHLLTAGETFNFTCNPQVDCFTNCCRNADMYLYPYDVIRMKNRLGMTSDEFLEKHTYSDYRDNEHFPSVMLKMQKIEGLPCPFLTDEGCTVYEDRPFSCRAYPLEPAVSRVGDYYHTAYFFTVHDHCHGHGQGREWTAEEWIADQNMEDYTVMNSHWVDMDSLFRSNPWGPQGRQSPALKMAAMACFNVDKFKDFVLNSSFLSRFDVPEDRLAKAQASDEDMMLLGFDFVKSFLTGKGPFFPKS